MQNIKVIIHLADNPTASFRWPYSHVPRVGERFMLEDVGLRHVVQSVYYSEIKDGSGFIAVVTVDRG